MTKDEILLELTQKVSSGEIKKNEIIQLLNLEKDEIVNGTKIERHFSISKMLYVLGAAVVVIGIVIFIAQIWDDMGSFGRMSVTLFLGMIFTGVGSSLLLKDEGEYHNIGMVFHTIGGVLIPGGMIVAVHEFIPSAVSLWPYTFAFIAVFVFYIILNVIHKNAVLTFFSIISGTTVLYLLVASIVDEAFYRNGDLYAYVSMVVGISYIFLGRAFRTGWNKKLVGILFFFGITGFLGASFSQIFDSVIWEILYIFIILGGFLLAVSEKSKSILVMSTIFIIAYLSYVTGEYFADSIGWPISLVILGFMFIGLGYGSITINKKYISN